MRSLVVLGVLLLSLGLLAYALPALQGTEVGLLARLPREAGAATMVTGVIFIIMGASLRPRPH